MIKQKFTKIVILLSFSLIFILLSAFILCIYIYWNDDKDICLDTSLCKEGLEVNTEYGLIKINKENCIKYNWKWIENSKMCNMQ